MDAFDVDRLPLREELDRLVPALAAAEAGVLVAAEGQVRLGEGGVGVDVHHAGLALAGEAHGLVEVAREDRAGEAEVVCVWFASDSCFAWTESK